ncbi:SWIM zinc finger family protein [Candidatus Woesebacteria bacterium]|nr:SWIM zinc finger family protein [Candidatus Woesebacteria bacterium]
MAFSFSRLIISETDLVTCERAFKLVNEAVPQATKRGTASCIGKIDTYEIWLGFWKGTPSWKCSCTEMVYAKSKKPCVHAIALAIAWDRNRGVPDPSVEDIQFLSRTKE